MFKPVDIKREQVVLDAVYVTGTNDRNSKTCKTKAIDILYTLDSAFSKIEAKNIPAVTPI